MNESCASSIHNYGFGSKLRIELHELVSSAGGVYGSRFSGGGDDGCVVALAEGATARFACAEVKEKFLSKYPSYPIDVFIAKTGSGLAALPEDGP